MKRFRRAEILIAFGFLITGLCWVLTSHFMFRLEHTDAKAHLIHHLSDFFFLLAISVILYYSIRFYRKHYLHNQSRYKYIFEANPMPLWIFSTTNKKFLLVNEAMVHKYGYSHNELMCITADEIRPASEREKLKNYLEGMKTGLNDAGLWIHKKKNGELFYVHIRANKIAYAGQEAVLVLADDITDIINKEKEILRLSMVVKNTSNGVIITDKERRIQWVNESFTRITGYSKEEAIGKRPPELLHGAHTEKSADILIAESIKEGKSFTGELLNYKKDGTPIWVQTALSPVVLNGEIESYVAIFIDITDRKDYEDKINDQNQRLKDIAFASSHIMRAPLANILGLVDLLDKDNIHDSSTLEVVGHIRTSAELLDGVVKDLVNHATN